MSKIRVAIADDHVLFVKGMKMILNTYKEFSLIIEAYNGQQLVDNISKNKPDVILLDLKMPEMDGVAVIQWVKKHYPSIKILMLTMDDDQRMITHLLREGAHGYLLKNEAPEVVVDAIQQVVDKGVFINETAAHAMLNQLKLPKDKTSESSHSDLPSFLTIREIEVLRLICQEKTTPEIAKTLFLSPRTIEGHRKKLLEKTGARNIAGLVIFATNHNLV